VGNGFRTPIPASAEVYSNHHLVRASHAQTRTRNRPQVKCVVVPQSGQMKRALGMTFADASSLLRSVEAARQNRSLEYVILTSEPRYGGSPEEKSPVVKCIDEIGREAKDLPRKLVRMYSEVRYPSSPS
jgi:hypothetical protein